MCQVDIAVNEHEKFATIAALVRHCFQLFLDAKSARSDDKLHKANTTYEEGLENLYGRLRVWAGNVAAHRDGNSSLDYRLRDASHLRKRVLDLLHDLADSLKDATAIVNGSKIPWEELSDSDSDSVPDDCYQTDAGDPDPEKSSELSQIMETLSEIVTCLFQLSMAIRNPAPHDHIINSASVATSGYEEFDRNHVQSKFPAAEPHLIERMGRAITRRRNYLKYRESRHSKLARGLIDVDSGTTQGGSTIATSLPPGLMMEGDSHAQYDDAFLQSDQFSETTFATSAGGNNGVRPPPPPPESDESQPFECPLCFYIITVSSKTSWERHVYEDLHPYTCTFPDCETPNKLYASQHLWFDHELRAHRSTWKCPTGCEGSFTTLTRIQNHMITEHENNGCRDSGEEDFSGHRQEPSPLAVSVCPLCEDPLRGPRSLRKHVGKHQRQLALFALPLSLFSEEHMSNSGNGSDAISAESDQTDVQETEVSSNKEMEEYIVGQSTEDDAKRNEGTDAKELEAAEQKAYWENEEKKLKTEFELQRARDEAKRKADHDAAEEERERIIAAYQLQRVKDDAKRREEESAAKEERIRIIANYEKELADRAQKQKDEEARLLEKIARDKRERVEEEEREWREFKLKQEENKEQAERDAKEVKEKIDSEMRARLYRAGYSIEAVEEILQGKWERKDKK